MNFGDILQIVLITGILFFWLGFSIHRLIPRWWEMIQRLILTPKYLKSVGNWVPKSKTNNNKSNS